MGIKGGRVPHVGGMRIAGEDAHNDVELLNWMVKVVERNVGTQNSSWGWSRRKKLAELSLPLMEYLTGRRDEDNNLIAFASYMRTTEDDLSGRARPVLYIYELQVVEGERGRGLGSSLLRRLEDIAINSDLPIMLTCFKANVDAMRFYTKAGYSIDEISPSRCGYHDYDYEILIKQVIHQTGATH